MNDDDQGADLYFENAALPIEERVRIALDENCHTWCTYPRITGLIREAQARAWDHGYQAGVGDEERCTHGSWFDRMLRSLTGHRLYLGKCYLYDTDNPYERASDEA